jgi:outer membrane protein
MKSLNIKLSFVTVLLGVLSLNLVAQPTLDSYLGEGLKNNLLLREKNISLEQAKQSLKIAKSFFLPSVNLLGDYTSGKGGRSIELPIGDLLNPVYSSLNQLTQSDQFAQVENVEQNFFPNNFYDARIRTTIPVINTDLLINQRIQNETVSLKEYEVEAYKRELVFNIKAAYYNYLSALAAVKIYESALGLVNQNVDVNESLLKNGKNLPANLLRSKSEAERIKAELNNARNQVTNSKKYFNFLLNKNLESEIIEEGFVSGYDPEEETTASIEGREELSMLKTSININESSLQLYRLSRLPKVNALLDLGSQASDWQVHGNTRYYLVGVQLSVPIFQGFRNNVHIHQSKLEIEKSFLKLQHATSQLQVSADISLNNLKTTKQNYIAAREQLISAKSYFTLLERGYQQGVNSLIEFIDARNQLTSSELQLSLRQYEMLIASAQLERETSSFNLPK